VLSTVSVPYSVCGGEVKEKRERRGEGKAACMEGRRTVLTTEGRDALATAGKSDKRRIMVPVILPVVDLAVPAVSPTIVDWRDL
jgi:hypothetical protein